MSITTPKFILSFDSGHIGTRYIDSRDSEKTGTCYSEDAMIFDTREEAQAFNDANNYICMVEEVVEEVLTYDVVFNSGEDSNSKYFHSSLEYCKNWIECNKKREGSYFDDYIGGTVSIVCDQTIETVFEESI